MYVQEHPDAYLKEIAQQFGCCPAAVLRRLNKLGITRKKSTFYKEQDPEKVRAYKQRIKDINPERLVYIDETGIDTQIYRRYARSKRGQRVKMALSGKRQPRIGLVAAQCHGKLLAPYTYSGTMKGALFEQWMQEHLLKQLPEGSVLVMDNAPFHKKEALYKIIAETSHTLIFLPPYSPDLNPIEHYWSALKRNLASNMHLYPSVTDALNSLINVN